ncbi:methyl-accepting chemotaxis protein [Aquibacillus halophilus]|nr:HAMP domain-containing methyl-accepting chemotaxis protein [Aquibacillus halophilus]
MFGFYIVIALVVYLSISNSLSLNSIGEDTRNIIEEELPLLITNEKLQINTNERVSLVRSYVLFGESKDLERFNELTEESRKLEDVMLQSNVADEFEILANKSKLLENYIQSNVFEAYNQGREDSARINLSTVNRMTDELISGYSELGVNRETSIVDQGEDLLSSANSSIIVGIVISLVVIIFSIIIAYIVSNRISKPIRKVSNRMNAIANGDLTNDPMVNRDQDEVGQLIDSTNKMSENLKDLLGEITNVSGSVSSQSETLTKATNEVEEGSNQIASTMQELSSGAEAQANHASELASSMSDFSEKVYQANESGESVYGSSQEILVLTDEGSNAMNLSIKQMGIIDGIVKNAVEKVSGLDKQSQEITKLIGVIKDIADQTNLLALNAAIEAARAGEHGKGFAVVADEVRKLAEQVSLSVTDITEIVGSIQRESNNVTESLTGGYKEVENGKNQIVSTGKTFEQINNSLKEMVDEIKLISTNLSGIASNSDLMNKAVEQIASVSEESAAGIEQTSASVQQTGSSMEEVASSANQLQSLTESLNGLISKFKLKV